MNVATASENFMQDVHVDGRNEIYLDPNKVDFEISRMSDVCIEFDVLGVHPSFANAIRRILISEIPTMAIEKVDIYQNTSIIQDEILAHRLGLVPIKADPRDFEYPDEDDDDKEQDTWKHSIEFRLHVTCKYAPKADPGELERRVLNDKIYSGDLVWVPLGDQETLYPRATRPIKAVHSDILMAKMAPGHEVELVAYAVKGLGSDHAKFSPVATAAYRFMPQVRLLKPVRGAAAERLQDIFAPGVIALEENEEGELEAVVDNPRNDTCNRNWLCDPELADAVEVGRVKDHFIFSVESVGAMPAGELVSEAIKMLLDKCDKFLEVLDGDVDDEESCEEEEEASEETPDQDQ